MSRDFLNDILEKFAQVTSIIVETSKIKEDLDHSSRDEDLKDLLERTEAQVLNLFEHSTSLKDLFDRRKKTIEISSFNGAENTSEQGGLNNSEEDPQVENEDVKNDVSQINKPVIKLVDIKKLVEPRTLIKQSRVKPRQNVNVAETVVLISSSDEEYPKKPKSNHTNFTVISKQIRPQPAPKSRVLARRKAAEQTIRKNRIQLQTKTSSESDGSDDEVLNRKSKLRNGNRQKVNQVEKAALSAASSGSGSDIGSISSSHSKNKKKKSEQKENSTAVEKTTESETEEPAWKSDSKFNLKCYVKILRIPCEKLKEYYLEKLELLEINKLRDVNSLKRKRRRSASENSHSGSDTDKPKRRNVSSERRTSKDKSGGESSSSEEEVAGTNKSASPLPSDTAVPILSNTTCAEEMADDALNLLNSDKDEDSGHNSDKEDDDGNKEKEQDKEDKEEERLLNSDKEDEPLSTDKEVNKENLADTPDKEKEKDTEKSAAEEEQAPASPKDKNVEDVNEKSDDENAEKREESGDGKKSEDEKGSGDKSEKSDHSEKEDSEKEDEDKNKEKDKSKKDWKKDKLLTDKLTSSDSEEELAKLKRKKEKLQEADSDGEPKLPKDKKKRLVKRRVKKTILSDSDSENKKESDSDKEPSSSSSSESEDEEEKKPKARKRVKRVQDSSEDEEEKSTRKQIRDIWSNDSLAETTKKAEAEERERKARILEKQKKYNQVYEADCLQNTKVEKVVLDFDEKTEKELLRVDDALVANLKPHQASGIQFMWDACFESLERAKTTKGSGCILAHCMGLGKTLQVIALSHTLLMHSEETNVRKILVVSPLNTVLNWVNEFKQWLPDNEDYEIYELVSYKQNSERHWQVKLWHKHGGVLIMGYDMFRNLSNPENKRIQKKMRTSFVEALVDPGPDLVICDEGHLLKNEKTNLSIAMNRIKTLRRIVLTGTPLQNNLKEYFCMVQFIKPNLLGTYREYLNRFVNPITNGQYTDSTPHDIQVMRKRSHVLHKMLDGVVQRRDYSVLQPYLPPKFEYILFLKLSEVQIKLYQHYMDHYARKSTDGSNRTSFLFIDFQALQRIWTHPRVLLDKSVEMRKAKETRDDSEEESEGSLKDFINDDDEEEDSTNSSSNSSSEGENREKSAPRKRVTRAAVQAAKENGEEIEDVVEVENPVEKEWWQDYCDGDELNVIDHSSKLYLLFEILKECEQIGDKVLLFSQSLYSLNVIEYFLGRIHDATQSDDLDSVGGFSGSWCCGLDYFRLDGSSSCDNRNTWCKIFNDPANTRARLFLISTRAGGLGINLVAANRVIIFDVSWNPSHDIQSIYRVYRFGQTKPCYIYRFVSYGTMEMKVYERQVTKQAISKRVIDEQQIDRHYNQNDLLELYKFEPNPGERPIPLVPKDVLLGELVQKFENRIYKYHEHQSLLENKEDEVLNEEERKAAWEEFESEKKQRVHMGVNIGRSNILMDLAMMNIVRKENPGWSEIQVRAGAAALHAHMQQKLAEGDATIFKRVQQECLILQAMQSQRQKDMYYQQQLFRAMQQKQLEAMKLQSWAHSIINQNQTPGTSHDNAAAGGPNDVIDLND